MSAFFHHLSYDFKSGIRDKGKLLMFYLFPLVFFALAGTLMTAVNPFFKETMLPGMILFAVMSSALLTFPGGIVTAREQGVFRSYRINGVPAVSILVIPVIGGVLHAAIVGVVISLGGAYVLGGVAPTNILGFAAAGLLSYAAFAGIGVLIGTASARDNASTMITQLIYIPSILLGGLMMPASILPEGFRRISLLLPSTHAMNALTGLGGMPAGAPVPWLAIAVLSASTVLDFALAAWIFQWDPRSTTPSRKAFAALLGVLPFAAAVVIAGGT
jgi:ABC-2 type transport system permease protein